MHTSIERCTSDQWHRSMLLQASNDASLQDASNDALLHRTMHSRREQHLRLDYSNRDEFGSNF